MAKKKSVSVTMKLNKDGTMTMRSTGGYDLRKLFKPQPPEPPIEPTDPAVTDTEATHD